MALRLLCLTVSLGLTSSDSQRLSSGLISESTQKCKGILFIGQSNHVYIFFDIIGYDDS